MSNTAGLTYLYTDIEGDEINGIKAGSECYEYTGPTEFAVIPVAVHQQQQNCSHAETRPYGTYHDPNAVVCVECRKWFNPEVSDAVV
jgi:hypothetical protein